MTEFIFGYTDETLSEKEGTAMKNAAVLALEKEGFLFDCEISVVITDSEGIREINKEYRGIDKPTDVLSFPQYEFVSPTVFVDDLEDEPKPIILGDIVIAKDVMVRQAEEIGHSFEDELSYLTVHSVLHLLGYDHMDEQDKKIMREREKIIVGEL